MTGFIQLRQEAEKRGNLIKAASGRPAPPDEACKLIGAYAQAEDNMIKYIDSHGAECRIPPRIGEQLKSGHNNTEALEKKVCTLAAMQIQQQRPRFDGPTLKGDFGDPVLFPIR